jgi:hypothetical protein
MYSEDSVKTFLNDDNKHVLNAKGYFTNSYAHL